VHCNKNRPSDNMQESLWFLSCRHDKGIAPRTFPATPKSPFIEPMPKTDRSAAILVAAGRGLRAGAGGPKQYRVIGGQTVIYRAMQAFCDHPQVFAVQPVVNLDDSAMFNEAARGLRHESPVAGGATRQASVHAGLEALVARKPDIVLIHDAARPFVTSAVISRAIEAAGRTGAAVPTVAVTDTIKQVGATGNVEATPDRATLRIAQTPQAFRFDVILEAHRRAAREGRSDFTDDAALAEWAGLTVATFEGDAANMKLTTPEDFVREEARLGAMLGDIRTGTGYDVHAFGDGDHVMICGVRVPHSRGFLAHSDGDVGLHALVDAILGALADGDIGSHFPPSDAKWKGASSDRFLKYAIDRVAARGGRVANLEVTLICERPKIGPLRDAMRTRIAEISGIDISRIAVKATTSERLGFTGREEGIAATASATIRLPWEDKTRDDKARDDKVRSG
jgi:2-C-methyl-D-erythritol 4-phosphate cytidylyltransferase/2-C-methyl-D-erythritol 2,4-cyclodiphosphate synthase